MPMYTHRCRQCKTEIDVYLKLENIDDAPKHCGQRMERIIGKTGFIPDIKPYMTIAADKETKRRKYITSRKQHREFLKKNGYEEMGNENFTPNPRKPKETEPDVPFNIFD